MFPKVNKSKLIFLAISILSVPICVLTTLYIKLNYDGDIYEIFSPLKVIISKVFGKMLEIDNWFLKNVTL